MPVRPVPDRSFAVGLRPEQAGCPVLGTQGSCAVLAVECPVMIAAAARAADLE